MSRFWRTFAPTLAVAAGVCAVAHAQEMIRYETRDGDTCPAIAQRLYGSASRIDVIHTYNSLGALPHRFPAGRVLNLPRVAPPPRQIADAEIAAVHNDVHAYTPGDHPAHRSDPLNRGNRVGTLADSSAEVTMGDERAVHLEEHTLVVVLGRYSYQTQQRETAEDTRLESGTLRSSLGALSGRPPPQPIAVSTPAAQVTTGVGETAVTVEPSHATRVEVHEGSAVVTAQGQHVNIAEGYGNRTEQGRPPAPPRPLPARPRWVRAPTPVTFVSATPTNALAEYGAAPGAAGIARWRVQLAHDRRFRDVVLDRRVAVGITAFEARDLPAAEFFLRVRAIDREGFEGQPSPVQAFRVVAPRIVPSVPGRRAAVEVDSGLFCALDGAALAAVTQPLELTPARAHVLRCADAADSHDVVEHAIALADSGPVVARGRVSAPSWDNTDGARRIAVRVMDAAGAPLDDAAVAGMLEGGGTLSGFTPTGEPGTWAATLRWQGPAGAARVHVSAFGAESAVIEVPAAQPPAVPVPAPRRVIVAAPRADLGVSVGVIPTLSRLGVGLAWDVSFRYHASFAWGDVLVGLRTGYARFGCSGGTAVATDYCARAPLGPQDTRVETEVFTAGIPVSVSTRFGASWVPYLTVEPLLALGRTVVSPAAAPDGTLRIGFGVQAVAGLQFEARPHTPFIEVGYRYSELPDDRVGALPIGGLVANVGYRVTW